MAKPDKDMQENIASTPDVAVTARRAKLPMWRRLRAPMRRDRLSAGIILFALLIITGMWAVIEAKIVHDRDDRIAEVMRQNANLARAFEEHTVRTLDYIDATLLALKERYEAEGAKVDLPAFYRQMRPNTAVLINAAITDASGQIILSAVPAQSVSLADREHFKVHLSGPDSGLFFISKPVLDRTSKQWSIVTTRRANNAEGQLVGVVTASIDPEYFSDFYRDVYRDTGNVVTLVGTDGIVRVRLAARSADLGQDISGGSAFQRMMASPVEPSALTITYIGESPVDGKARVVAARRIHGYPLLVFVGTPVTEVLAPEVARIRNYRLAGTGASVLIGFFAFTLVSFSRRRSESARALRSASDLLERTGAIARVGGWELDLRTQVLSWSGQTCRIHEVDPPVAPALAQAIAFYAPEARPVIEAAVRAGIEQGTPWDLELPLITAKGCRIWARAQGSVVFEHGEAVTLVGAFQDITGRKTADLREATHSLTMSALANGAPLAEVLTTLVLGVEAEHPGALGSVLLLDAAGTHLLTGAAPSLPAFYNEAIHGVAIGPAVGSCGTAAFTGERVLVADIQTDPLWTDFKAVAAQAGLAACWSEPIRSSRGRVVGTFAFYYAQPRLPGEAEINTIVTAARLAAMAIERTQANEALRESELRWQFALEGAGDGVWDSDVPSGKAFFSKRYKEMLGYAEDEIGTGISEWSSRVHPEDMPRVRAALQPHLDGKTAVYASEYRVLCKDGGYKWILDRGMVITRDAEGKPLRVVGTHADITGRRQAEAEKETLQAQLVQSQKMEAIGTLAGGIAHDFNNILAGLLGGLSLLEVEPGDLTGREADLEDMKALVERGAQLTKQLLGFARRGKYDVRPLNLGHVVAKTSAMFGSTRRDITVHLDVAPGLSAVLMDHMQMEQVLLNLFVNAGQAMAGGGRLLLRVEDVLLGPEDTGPHGAAPGQFVKVVVTDTGTGMDAETQARIFEPFFTTKEPGKGTGLGLASVYGIVKNCDGFIQVKSELGKGTTFTLFWPASDEPAAAEKPAAVTVQRGQGTILIVDDEADNLSIYARMLGKLGYDVLTAGGGKEAIALLRQHGANVSLVLLDLTMPEMSGAATYRALREVIPGVKVLLSSGYSIDGQAQELLAQGCSGFIQKPFDTRTLSAKVRECF